MKKFYTFVTTQADQGGFSIRLDGKPVKTPSGKILVVPTIALAEALAQEWTAQQGTIDPNSMPLTQIATTALDRIAAERAAITTQVMAYLDTDLLCYRATLPVGLALRQAQLWDPWLSWFSDRFGVMLETTTGLQALTQPQAAQDAAAQLIQSLDDNRFCVLQLVTGLAGSLVLALAFFEKAASPADVFAAVTAEESFKAEIYNEALHGAAPQQEKKQQSMRRDLDAAARFLDLLKTA